MPFLLGGFGCVCIIFFSLTGSIYFVLNQLQQQPEDRQLHPDDGSLNRPDSPSIVIFAAPRRFSTDKPDLVGARQDMAVRSWLALSPDVSVVLFGQHPSIFALARSLGPRVTVESAIDFTYAETSSHVSSSLCFSCAYLSMFHCLVLRTERKDTDMCFKALYNFGSVIEIPIV